MRCDAMRGSINTAGWTKDDVPLLWLLAWKKFWFSVTLTWQ